MAEKRGVVGGLVATNTSNGYIENCYCVTKFNGKGLMSGGFAGENFGKIERSFSELKASNLMGGFCGNLSDNLKYCYYFHKLKKNNRIIEKLQDPENSLARYLVRNEADVNEIGFMNEAWKYSGGEALFAFDGDWMYTDWGSRANRKEVKIHTVEQLYEFARLVNSGNKTMLNAWVKLENNIDLKGKSWMPIGEDRMNAFSGIFDGNGYSISNFKVDNEAFANKGLFGYLRGGVFNLSVDCMIKGDGVIGGIAAINEGIVNCCGATVQFLGKGDDLCVGGLVGRNSGKIYKSYAAGVIRFIFVPVLPIAVLLSAICLATVVTTTYVPALQKANRDYNTVDDDRTQKEMDDDASGEETIDDGVGNVITFTFNEHLYVNLEKNYVLIGFQNPSTDFNNLIVRVYLDQDKTQLLAESGAISPGYEVKAFGLQEGLRHTLAPGEYQGKVELIPYNKDTGEKSMMNVELPVTITVQ